MAGIAATDAVLLLACRHRQMPNTIFAAASGRGPTDRCARRRVMSAWGELADCETPQVYR